MSEINLLKNLAGEWVGAGIGLYPTIEPFEYLETLRFTLDEKGANLHYEQKTRRRNIGQSDYVSSHWETGFLRLLADDQVEIANVQIGGRVEILIGSIESTAEGIVLRLKSSLLANDPRMQEASRTIRVNRNSLHYSMYMHTTTVPHLALHLEAKLLRQLP
jgi:hypothetical protein